MAEPASNVVMIEDSPTEAALALALLEGEPCHVQLATTGVMGLRMIERVEPEVVLLDINLPDMSGLDVLPRVTEAADPPTVVMVTGHAGVDMVVECMRRGAFDYLAKPLAGQRMCVTVRNAVRHHRMMRLVQDYRAPYESGFHGMIGSSPAMCGIYRTIEAAAPSTATVFISGESGTGKELCAEAIHRLSPRGERPFIALNCAVLHRELAESELFGHVRGAFTGAVADRAGAVASADRGTLFLDEIGEMPVELQAKLLRFVQTGRYRQLGDSQERQADVRIVSATNRDAKTMLADGVMREDLFFRLHVIPLHLPPLRERGDDVLEIARHLCARISAAEGRTVTGFTAAAEARIMRHHWPGNVRELENAIRHAVVMAEGRTIDAPALPRPVPHGSRLERGDACSAGPVPSAATARPPVDEAEAALRPLAAIEREAIETALAACGGNVTAAARRLEIDPSTIHRKRRAWSSPGEEGEEARPDA